MPDAQPIGRITSGIPLNTLIMRTVSLLHQRLPVWRDNPHRVKAEQNETQLSSDMCKFLNRYAPPMIQFNYQEPQPANRSVDLSVTPGREDMYIGAVRYTYNTPFLLIEAKRLPGPPPAERKHEYVTGVSKQSGGIQRFKLGLHGKGHDSVVIIGYIQQRSCGEWHQTINAWITDLVNGKLQDGCTWRDGEQLKCLTEDVQQGTLRCESLHPRNSDAQELLIYHIWINMNHVTSGGQPQ